MRVAKRYAPGRFANQAQAAMLNRVAAGVIRGMADDYGALALIAAQKGQVTVNIALHDFTDQRHFTLAPEATGASHAYRYS